MKLIFASNNRHKVEEVKAVVPSGFEIVSLEEAGIDIDIPEPHDTLEANATEKSSTIYRMTGMNCFSEDTGLEVAALNGEPGVKSARYAGENRSFEDNILKLLSKLKDQPSRRARFRAVISLILEGKEKQFEGVCEGMILEEKKGSEGFGYDPVFQPDGAELSFAEMGFEEKKKYSHRSRAMAKLVAFLNQSEQSAKT